MKASGLSTTVNGKKKKPPTKPPVGLDPHMLGNRAIAAAGLGKRGEINKACMHAAPPHPVPHLLCCAGLLG